MNTDSASRDPADPQRKVLASAAAPNAGLQKIQAVRVSSQALFSSGAKELEIEHHGTLYRLRQTALGKLILTK